MRSASVPSGMCARRGGGPTSEQDRPEDETKLEARMGRAFVTADGDGGGGGGGRGHGGHLLRVWNDGRRQDCGERVEDFMSFFLLGFYSSDTGEAAHEQQIMGGVKKSTCTPQNEVVTKDSGRRLRNEDGQAKW